MSAPSLRAHAIFAISMGCLGLVLQGFWPAPQSHLGSAVTASAATMWCVVDSLSRGSYWGRSYQFATFLFWPLAVPAYLFWSRGKVGCLLGIGYIVALVVLIGSGAVLAEMLGP